MMLLTGFLDVVVRGIGLVAFSAAVGGVAFALLVLRPFSGDLRWHLLQRSLRLVVWGGVGVAVTQLMSLLLQLAALGPPDGWPILAFLHGGRRAPPHPLPRHVQPQGGVPGRGEP